MDAKYHTNVTNNKIVGKRRTEDSFDLLQYLSEEEKKFLAERAGYANVLVLLPLTEFSLWNLLQILYKIKRENVFT